MKCFHFRSKSLRWIYFIYWQSTGICKYTCILISAQKCMVHMGLNVVWIQCRQEFYPVTVYMNPLFNDCFLSLAPTCDAIWHIRNNGVHECLSSTEYCIERQPLMHLKLMRLYLIVLIIFLNVIFTDIWVKNHPKVFKPTHNFNPLTFTEGFCSSRLLYYSTQPFNQSALDQFNREKWIFPNRLWVVAGNCGEISYYFPVLVSDPMVTIRC